jgi:hypothetical protein
MAPTAGIAPTFLTEHLAGDKYYWGPPTSSLNWCEYDHEVSPYIAECESSKRALFPRDSVEHD